MILTSYFANHRNFPKGKKLVSISRYTPKGMEVDFNALELAPQPQLLKDYKDGLIDDSEYTERYIRETLSELDPQAIAKQYDGSIFLCYEKTGDFCHRHIVSEWLRSVGINTEEIKAHTTIAVVGTRGFSDYEYFKKLMDRLVSNYAPDTYSFVSGGAKSGADHLIERYAKENGIGITIHYPEWHNKEGHYIKAAGFIRNKKIYDDCDMAIMFWDGESKGTKHGFKLINGKKLYVVEYLSNKVYVVLPVHYNRISKNKQKKEII